MAPKSLKMAAELTTLREENAKISQKIEQINSFPKATPVPASQDVRSQGAPLREEQDARIEEAIIWRDGEMAPAGEMARGSKKNGSGK
eukprot:3534895-Prymnesium_polylepis.1